MNDNKFTLGLFFGLILGGGAVFLLGTRTGKNLLKILSEQGMDGLMNLLQEYDLNDLEEMEDEGEVPEEVQNEETSPQAEVRERQSSEKKEESPKKHFFRRVKK